MKPKETFKLLDLIMYHYLAGSKKKLPIPGKLLTEIPHWDDRCPPAIVYTDALVRWVDGLEQNLFYNRTTEKYYWKFV